MDDAKGLCSEWQSLLEGFREVFTLGGWARFAQWATGTVLCSEEHTITPILTGLGLEDPWRNVEHFAEYGAWDRETVERQLMRLVEREHPARRGRHLCTKPRGGATPLHGRWSFDDRQQRA